ncbi:hypothetical protein KVK88_06660 [Helicobacter pylori]|nr:hypothetical protein KVK88_06660 [Helicobacter pylori]
MKTIEWNKEQRKVFQDLLKKFVEPIDIKAKERRQIGKTPTTPEYASCQNGLNEFLAPWGYAYKISLGSWDLSYKPSIAFCRQDILGEGFVNGEKPTPTKGFYLWFAYCWRNDAEKFYLCIGRSIEKNGEKECQKCPAYDKIVKLDGDAYYQESYDDLEADLENITNDFLHFANEFNQIPTAHFELEPSASH